MHRLVGSRLGRALGALLVALSVSGAGVVLAPVDPAGASTIRTSTPVRACVNLADASCYGWTSLPAGATVTMRCWTLGSWYAGTDKWFWVDGPGRQGFVSANHVGSQATVGYCENKPSRYRASRWAGSQLKQTSVKSPITGVTYDSRGWCLRFVRDAWYYGGVDIGSAASAYDYWKRSGRTHYGPSYGTQPPVGALVFWGPTSGNPYGHVALSIGDGYAISTYERSTTTVHIMSIASRNAAGYPYLGHIRI